MTGEGTVLAGRYELGAPLGRGGMADVYLGTDRVLDRQVAVKILGSWLDASFQERFRREALAAARLSHPNLVAVYDTGSEDGTHFIVMEHVPGRTLAEMLRAEGPLGPERATSIAAGVAEALAVAHRAGIVHRDVKPSNVMVTPDGGAKLMDLGIARRLDGDGLTRPSTVLGTAGYISPEQARGEAVDHRSDIYSLGCVLFEMLTGRPPFEADNPVAVAYQHVHGSSPAPSSLRDGIPPWLDAVVLRAMEKDREARFGSAEQLASALRDRTEVLTPPAATTPLPVTPRAPTTAPAERRPRRTGRPPRRRSAVPFALALVALALLGAIGVALLSGEDPVRGRAPAGAGARSPSASDSPSPSPSASPSPSPSDDPVDEAAAGIFAVLQEGVAVDGISGRAASEILREVNDAMRKFLEGDTEHAMKKLEDLESKVDELADRGEVDDSLEPRIDRALERLWETFRAVAPPADGDGDDDD